MELPPATAAEPFELEHDADVGAVRRRMLTIAATGGLDEARASDAAIVATEASTNVLKHAKHGGALLWPRRGGGVALVAWDRGPGMDVDACLRDGVSTAGTSGAGLGAIARLASRWDAYARPGLGTIVWAELEMRGAAARPAERAAFAAGGLALPYPGQTACGDAWTVETRGDVAVAIAVDGLGHGPGAATAATAVLAATRPVALDRDPADLLAIADRAARATRGAAATIARLDRAAGTLTVAGVGNVQVWLVAGPDDVARQLVTQHGTLGQASPRIRQEAHALPADAFVVLHSDGLKTRWDLAGHPGLTRRAPAVIAAALWRDFQRGRDDASVVVLRARGDA